MSAQGLYENEAEELREELIMYQECGQEEKVFAEDCTDVFMEFFDCIEMLIEENDCATDADIENLWLEIDMYCGHPEECWAKE